MILAGASCDDIFVIVLFSTFVTMAQGGSAKATDFLNIPVSIILGVLLGSLSGFVLFYILRYPTAKVTNKKQHKGHRYLGLGVPAHVSGNIFEALCGCIGTSCSCGNGLHDKIKADKACLQGFQKSSASFG